MDIKQNDATRNRPMGTRVIDSSAVLIHLPHYLVQLKKEKAWLEGDRNGITLFKSDQLTIVLTCLKKGADMKDVQTEGYTTLNVLEGLLITNSNEEEKQSVPGDILVFHPCISYSLVAAGDCSFLLTHFKESIGSDEGRFI